MRIFSESWNDENHAMEKKKKKVWMEKVTLHTVSVDSDWHFLTATSRQEKNKKQKKPWNPHSTQISNVL